MMDPDEEKNVRDLVASHIAMTVGALLFMSLRFGCKARYGKQFTLDDYILAFAWICLAIYAGVISSSTTYGMGKHVKNISHEDVVIAHMRLGTADFFAIIAIAIAKSSFAVTLLRLVQERWEKVLIWFILVTVNVTLWLSAIFIFTSCTPLDKMWDNAVPGTCWDSQKLLNYHTFSGAYSAASDFVLALFPWVLLWDLRMRRIEKIGVCVAMSFGVFSGITAALKTSYIQQSARWKDFTFLTTDVLVWSAVEIAVVIVAASIPVLRLALKEVGSSLGSGGTKEYQLSYVDPNRAMVLGANANIHERVQIKSDIFEDTLKSSDYPSEGSVAGEQMTFEIAFNEPGLRRASNEQMEYGDLEGQTWRRELNIPRSWRYGGRT